MKCLVTGAAGFIGSHLCERLLADGHEVVGLDDFIPYYPKPLKQRNIVDASKHDQYQFHSIDLRVDAIEPYLNGVDAIFHLAAMPGLAQSWTNFEGYWTCNVLATQRLLEATRSVCPDLKRWIYVSTSSVYGKFASGDETLPTKPISPYGVTKLAGEQLARAYAEGYQIPVVVLRYFSIYGPRQRPDMAYNLFMKALIENRPITVFGDGQQVRGNTFVLDCVDATVKALESQVGEIYNVGGGEMISIRDVLTILERISGKRFEVRTEPARIGDQRHTFADTSKIRRQLKWEPRTTLEQGLAAQWSWHLAESAELIR
jgi:nucleoside-diphosphate-sugar epimerase